MLKAQVECINVEDKRMETAMWTVSNARAHTHTDMPQINIETIFKQAEE